MKDLLSASFPDNSFTRTYYILVSRRRQGDDETRRRSRSRYVMSAYMIRSFSLDIFCWFLRLLLLLTNPFIVRSSTRNDDGDKSPRKGGDIDPTQHMTEEEKMMALMGFGGFETTKVYKFL